MEEDFCVWMDNWREKLYERKPRTKPNWQIYLEIARRVNEELERIRAEKRIKQISI